jgi:hypothetical protein
MSGNYRYLPVTVFFIHAYVTLEDTWLRRHNAQIQLNKSTWLACTGAEKSYRRSLSE